MTFTNKGLKEIGTVSIRNLVGETPTNQSFAGVNNTYTGSEEIADLNDEFIRKEVSWAATGNNSKWIVQLNSTESNGDTIGTLALVGGPTIGENVLFSINQSFIGVKTSSFNVQVEGEVIIRRPTV